MLGSVIPSSPFLVRQLMNAVDWQQAKVIVEFGPGVGTITREILKRMRTDATLVVVETNQAFVQHLEQAIPDRRLQVVHGSATEICGILEKHNLPAADYIISSIPYSLMTDAVRREILDESRRALQSGGTMLVFQYTRRLLPYLQSTFSSRAAGVPVLQRSPGTDISLHAVACPPVSRRAGF